MFAFVTRYLAIFKYIPGAAMIFDTWLKLWSLIVKPDLLNYIDDIEAEVLKWPGTNVRFHKYGGLQFNYEDKEIGHIHSNGLLDVLLSRKIKQCLLAEERITEHHVFKNTGWISFYINTDSDKKYALKLLRISYNKYNQVTNQENLFA